MTFTRNTIALLIAIALVGTIAIFKDEIRTIGYNAGTEQCNYVNTRTGATFKAECE